MFKIVIPLKGGYYQIVFFKFFVDIYDVFYYISIRNNTLKSNSILGSLLFVPTSYISTVYSFYPILRIRLACLLV